MQIQFTDRLSASQIQWALENFDRNRYSRNKAYYEGKNVKILERKKEDKTPNWIVSVPYARKIIKTVAGYMYKPGLITYSSENDQYMDVLLDVFDENKEQTKTASIGEQTSVQGVGFEVHYVDNASLQPMFSKLAANQGIPIYDYAIEPELKAFIYFYQIDSILHIYVYYADIIEHWIKDLHRENGLNLANERQLPTKREEAPHEYEAVPVNVYKNNEEMVGDFEPVLSLIDAYDALATDCMNEVDRFSNAYMILKNIKLSREDAKRLKEVRVFENLGDDAAVEILTKDIPHGYFQYLSDFYRREIHKQSHVPNFIEEASGGQLSGVAIDKLLYDLEFIAETKETLFREGLRKRIELINTILRKANTTEIGEEWDIDIHFQRNKPQNMKESAEIINLLKGIVSTETLIKEYIPFVKDPQAELQKAEAEHDPYLDDRFTDLEET